MFLLGSLEYDMIFCCDRIIEHVPYLGNHCRDFCTFVELTWFNGCNFFGKAHRKHLRENSIQIICEPPSSLCTIVLLYILNCARKIQLNRRFHRHQYRREKKKNKSRPGVRKTPVRLQFTTGARANTKEARALERLCLACARVGTSRAEIASEFTAGPHTSIPRVCCSMHVTHACTRMGCFKSYHVIETHKHIGYCFSIRFARPWQMHLFVSCFRHTHTHRHVFRCP